MRSIYSAVCERTIFIKFSVYKILARYERLRITEIVSMFEFSACSFTPSLPLKLWEYFYNITASKISGILVVSVSDIGLSSFSNTKFRRRVRSFASRCDGIVTNFRDEQYQEHDIHVS